MPVTVMPMRAVFSIKNEAAELGWNHEYTTLVPLPGRVFLRSLPISRNSNRSSVHDVDGQGYIYRRNETNGS